MVDRTFYVQAERQREFLCSFVKKQSLPFQAQIGPILEQRTLSANARLWALHTLASEISGYTPAESHEEMLCEHFGYTIKERTNPWTGEIEFKRIPNKRSSTRNKKEFAVFMDFVEIFYGEKLGVWLSLHE